MTPLRQSMIHDLTIRGLAKNTQKSYLQAVTGLNRYYRCSPDQLSAQDVQNYLVWLHQERGLSWTSCNTTRHGLRFFYRITLGWPEPHFYLPGAKEPSRCQPWRAKRRLVVPDRRRRVCMAGIATERERCRAYRERIRNAVESLWAS